MARDMDQDIPMVRKWVEERVRHYMGKHGKQGEVEVIPHPNPDFSGVQVRFLAKGESKPVKLDVRESDVRLDEGSRANRQINAFVRSLKEPE